MNACYALLDLDVPERAKVDIVGTYDPVPIGFGKYKNVITNLMMERLAAIDGPTGGKITRPSDEKEIETAW